MIKIDDMERPPELTNEVVDKKTKEYIESKKINITKHVWNEKYIKDRLEQMSNGKCCYCEGKLGKDDKEMNIDHYHPKCKYPEEVVSWTNLLPACKTCNGNKRSHDTKLKPIINPRYEDPREYLFFYRDFYRSKNNSSKGNLTKTVLDLNRTEAVQKRHEITDEASKSLQSLFCEAKRICNRKEKKGESKYDIRNGVKGLLKEAQPESEYSAAVATCIFEDPYFKPLTKYVKKLELWDTEMEELYEKAEEICLFCEKVKS
ncbi:MAG: hypothetical protein FWF87_01025 [Synergistaceae bacterium]|nr:hypothetical protein [Synergistaceae bacterium]